MTQKKSRDKSWFDEVAQTSHDDEPRKRSPRSAAILIIVFVVVLIVISGVIVVLVSYNAKTQQTPERAAKTMVEAIVNRDGEAWCNVMEPTVRKQIEDGLKQGSNDELALAGLQEPTCEEYFRVMMDILGDSDFKSTGVTYQVVWQKEKTARVNVIFDDSGTKKDSTIPLDLVKIKDTWYVTMEDSFIPTK